MKERHRKTRRAAAGLPPLAPEQAAAIKEQLARLREALDAGAEGEQLRDLVTHEPADPAWDLHLLRELEKIPHPAVPALLAALFGQSPDKERRKALKRALHLFKTRGVPVPEDLLPREAPEAPISPEAPALSARISSVYGNGEGFVILEGPREILGGGTLLMSRVSDTQGFRECSLFSLSKRRREDFWREFVSEGVDEMVPVPPSFALRLLEEALALTPDGEPHRDEYLPLRETLWRHLGRPDEAPTLSDLLPPLDPAERNRALEDARKLARDHLFITWVPTFEEIKPWLGRLEGLQDSPLVLTESQQTMRQDSILEEATAALFPPEDRARWGRRLLKMAYFFHLKDKTEEVRAALAAAESLLSKEQSPLSGENPFLRELVIYALLMAEKYLEQEKPKAESSSLILPPWTP
jgi:hypothetical protein